ncbi:MAG: 2-oxo acid dehydrogenase subunit E2 [Desulfurococcaceae archaeon]|jgi:pyruvate dehydrogenase E2 component (dihydrolipoamide acetyltransferase)|nr:2-oxo acid dehydrogenase subunit E2 [Desulfurococcaceae archaeon]
MALRQVKLPDIGEGLVEGEIVEWLVKEGDYVKMFQPLVRVLTAKATVEIPSPFEGRILRLLAKPGDVVRVGAPIAEIEAPEVQVATGAPGASDVERVESRESAREALQVPVRAPPRVRKLARELGVDLSKVKGTGPGGVITEEDVLRYAEESKKAAEAPRQPALVEGAVERVPLKGIRRIMASKMVEAKSRIPHAYIVEEVDVTELVKLRDVLRQDAESKGVKLTLLPFIVKAVVKALKEYPLLNASLDEERGEIIIKKFYNIGVAVDTPQGLVVPVIKGADGKGLYQIAREIGELAEKAREGKTSLEDVTGGTFSITNIGSVGTVLGMAIINYPEAAILGVHRLVEVPRYVDGELKPRKIVYLSLSFDHRFIEGAYATRFLLAVKRYLENPAILMASEEEFK